MVVKIEKLVGVMELNNTIDLYQNPKGMFRNCRILR